MAGVTWAAAMLGEASDSEIDFAQDGGARKDPTHPISKQAWGAYEKPPNAATAYATQLYNIGVFAETTEHGLPVPSAGIGDSIADAFGEALGPLGARMFAAIQSGSVSRRSLAEMAPALPSAIASAGHERQCYENLLFAKAGLDRESDRSRKRSLQLILKLVQQLGSVPAVQDVRWQLYSAVNADSDSQNDAASDLSTQRRRWWVYQANDLTHICYETLLKYTLDRLEAHSDGVALGSLIAEVVAGLRGAAEDWWPTWAAFVATHVPPAPQHRTTPVQGRDAGRPDGRCLRPR